jgi:hypothetical protein
MDPRSEAESFGREATDQSPFVKAHQHLKS